MNVKTAVPIGAAVSGIWEVRKNGGRNLREHGAEEPDLLCVVGDVILHEVGDTEAVVCIGSLADLKCLIAEEFEVSKCDLKCLLLIDSLIAELLNRCDGEVALEARDRLCTRDLQQLRRLIEHVRERIVERLEVLVDCLELRADNVPVEVVQLDVADADVGDVGVERIVKVCIICV